MTDRETLELAAKAAGYRYTWNEQYECLEVWEDGYKNKMFWQPHRDDGDALRLSVALGLVVDCSRPSAAPPFVRHDYSPSDCRDHAEATRRAIVRAAAEIGRSMNSDD